ncbi:MAG: ligase-associated DNA damage response endonuclease PdeM [Silicimonas sp.]|nr:ligase-associated DNA damage response endonuclease PdeM [Silicimonas sp.]
MNSVDFDFQGETLTARPSGALFWKRPGLLVISDLHLGKSERIARRGGPLLPPYETKDTLDRLSADIDALQPATVLCLGDSFDDLAASQSLPSEEIDHIRRLQAGRRWLWLEGNHDPGPLDLGGEHLAEWVSGPLTFRHIATAETTPGEISGHYHPKAKVRYTSRPCFMCDGARLILPAYGRYTGGLDWTTPILRRLFADKALAYLTGPRVIAVPVPKAA